MISIRKKAGWSKKIFDKEIANRYISEAIAQGMEKDHAQLGIRELRSFAQQEVQSERVTFSDKCVPEKLREELLLQLNTLVDRPLFGEPDWHPGSDQKVLDLIHPSMYCYVEGESQISPSSPYANKKARDALLKKCETLHNSFYPRSSWVHTSTRRFEKSTAGYQWLPATYNVAKDGKTTITSYINNLDRSKHRQLYQSFAEGFECVLPLFEKVLPELNLRGRPLQVITKACNYVLRPGETYQGVWHVEGMPTEMIVGSGIFYYQSSPFLEDDGLAFRKERDIELDWPTYMDYEQNRAPAGGFHDWRMNVELGAVPTPQGRVIVFGNHMQHCVTLLHNPSKTETATRRIVCWFLVHPEIKLISTEDVPPQQWDQAPTLRTQGALLILISRQLLQGVSLPRDVVLKILQYSHNGMTLAKAKKHRAALMKERKVIITRDNQELEREYSLCEH